MVGESSVAEAVDVLIAFVGVKVMVRTRISPASCVGGIELMLLQPASMMIDKAPMMFFIPSVQLEISRLSAEPL